MKITIALGFFNPCPPVRGGGVERMWYQLGQEFARRENEVTILSRTWAGFPSHEREGKLEHLRIRGFDHRRKLITNLLLDVVWSFRLLRRAPKADILVTNSIFFPILSSFFKFCGLTVVNLNRFPKGQLRCYRRVKRIQAPSSSIAEAASKQAPALASRIRVIPNSTDLDPFLSIARTAGADAITIGYFGRIHPEKGIEILIRAGCALLKEENLPPWRIVIRGPHQTTEGGGGEDYLEALKEIAGPLLQQHRLQFLPPTFETRDIPSAYREMDIFCYPSIAEKGETFGIAVLEAMASGLPIVISKLNCFSELLMEERNGFSFDHTASDSSSILASRLATLLRSSQTRLAMGTEGREMARRFDVKVVAEQHLEDFKLLLESLS